jgi:hypothetical protein
MCFLFFFSSCNNKWNTIELKHQRGEENIGFENLSRNENWKNKPPNYHNSQNVNFVEIIIKKKQVH